MDGHGRIVQWTIDCCTSLQKGSFLLHSVREEKKLIKKIGLRGWSPSDGFGQRIIQRLYLFSATKLPKISTWPIPKSIRQMVIAIWWWIAFDRWPLELLTTPTNIWAKWMENPFSKSKSAVFNAKFSNHFDSWFIQICKKYRASHWQMCRSRYYKMYYPTNFWTNQDMQIHGKFELSYLVKTMGLSLESFGSIQSSLIGLAANHIDDELNVTRLHRRRQQIRCAENEATTTSRTKNRSERPVIGFVEILHNTWTLIDSSIIQSKSTGISSQLTSTKQSTDGPTLGTDDTISGTIPVRTFIPLCNACK